MRWLILAALTLLQVCWIIVGRAQDVNLPVNVHIGVGFGVPVSNTSTFAGLSGSFQVGAGPNISKHNSVFGEFMWQGLPANRKVLVAIANAPNVNPSIVSNPVTNLLPSTNLYALTANYKYHMEGHRYGFYIVAGGGWYYRHIALNNYTIQPGTVCEPVWDWYGYTCVNGLVSTENTLATHGVSSGGVNGGGGVTINLSHGDYPTKFYMEARYHYSPQGGRVPTEVVPVTFGLRW
jgi:hypothetical protein